MKNKIESTVKILNKPWGEMVNYVNYNSEKIDAANNLAIRAFEKGLNNSSLILLFACLLEHNNILFHKKASYTVYQKLADCLNTLINNKLITVDPIIKARGYSNSVYADFIFKNKTTKERYEKKLLNSISLFESNNELINERFVAYINISQFYLFKGEYLETISYLGKAKKLLNDINIPNYRALFWYHYSWIYVEIGEYKKASKNIGLFFKNIKQNLVSPAIYLHGMNIYSSIEFRLGNYKKAFLYANKCYKLAVEFYETEIKDVVAENLVTMGRYYKLINKYDKAELTIKKAISIFEIIFGSSMLDPSQAVARVILGEIYEAQQRYKQAFDEYSIVEKYYKDLYKNNFFQMNEVSTVLANMAILAQKIGNKNLATIYMQKLVKNFSVTNCNVQRAQRFFEQRS